MIKKWVIEKLREWLGVNLEIDLLYAKINALKEDLEEAQRSATPSGRMKALFSIEAYDYNELPPSERNAYMRQVETFVHSSAWKNEFNSTMEQLNYWIMESETMEAKETLKKLLQFFDSVNERWKTIASLLTQELSQMDKVETVEYGMEELL